MPDSVKPAAVPPKPAATPPKPAAPVAANPAVAGAAHGKGPKMKIHQALSAVNPDGSPNWGAIYQALKHVEQQQKDGHYKITMNISEQDNPDGSADLSFKIHRAQTDPKASAAPAPPLHG